MNKKVVAGAVSGLCFLIVSGMLLAVILMTVSLKKDAALRFEQLEARITDRIAEAGRETSDEIGQSSESVMAVLSELRENTQSDLVRQYRSLNALERSIGEQKRQTADIEKTFSGILAEQQKQHIGTVTADTALQQKFDEAKKNFEAKNYYQSYQMFSEVAGYQKDNFEAQFYAYYSLFLQNTMDSSVYQKVIDGFDFLERNGYMRNEMDEVRQLINEEQAMLGKTAEGME